MAESAVAILLQTVLIPLAVQEISSVRRVSEEIKEIKDEFHSMQAFLKDADAKEDGDEGLKEWVKQVREVAYETEDVLDEYLLLPDHRLQRMIKGETRHQFFNRIKKIKNKLKQISNRKELYGLNKEPAGSSSRAGQIIPTRDPRQDALLIEEAQLVGINEYRDDLIGWLVNFDRNSLGLGIISVYGEGGLGKTALVKKVFDSRAMRDVFPHRLWVTFSQTYDINKILKNLILKLLNGEDKTKFQGEVKSMHTTDLKEMLQNCLRGKRYFMSFDDIWKLDAWNDFKNVFPDDNGCGSRIMVTTRYQNVARACVVGKKYCREFKLPRLSTTNSMKLFYRNVFSSDDVSCCPTYLRETCQKFLHKCNGLPLAIVSIAGFLRSREQIKWGQIYENLMERNHEHLKDLNCIFSLSYTDLPCHLKSCFLYLCIFPEDYSIDCNSLFRLWIAEGFVERRSSDSSTIEDIARGCLDELISMSLVQVEAFDATGKAKRVRIHDLMREFIIMKAREQGFVAHLDGERLQDQMVGRRLSIFNTENLDGLLKRDQCFSLKLRSFTQFDLPNCFITMEPTLFSSFKLLKVLSLVYVFQFPHEILKLLHLRYLNVESSYIESLPSSIGQLRNLEVLIMKNCQVTELPYDILNLNCLRHLSIRRGDGKGVVLPVNIQRLNKLEHLSVVQAEVKKKIKKIKKKGRLALLKNLAMLTQMRKLVVVDLIEEDGVHLLASVEKMKYLRSLSVISNQGGDLNMYNLLSPPCLEKLFMDGRLGTLPSWISKLRHLAKLTLKNSLIQDHKCILNGLERLPCLVELRLINAFTGGELQFKIGGFPKLKLLKLGSLWNLNVVIIDEGAMPSIQTLEFIDCEDLKKVPNGIEHLTALESIHKQGMPESFDEELNRVDWKAEKTPVIY